MLIYVVDDHEVMREATVIMIRRFAKNVTIFDFADFETFINAVEVQGMPDILILDLKLPGIAGCEGVKRARHHCPTTKLAVYSATPASEREQECIQSGADVYVAKSADPASFISSIKKLLLIQND